MIVLYDVTRHAAVSTRIVTHYYGVLHLPFVSALSIYFHIDIALAPDGDIPATESTIFEDGVSSNVQAQRVRLEATSRPSREELVKGPSVERHGECQ